MDELPGNLTQALSACQVSGASVILGAADRNRSVQQRWRHAGWTRYGDVSTAGLALHPCTGTRLSSNHEYVINSGSMHPDATIQLWGGIRAATAHPAHVQQFCCLLFSQLSLLLRCCVIEIPNCGDHNMPRAMPSPLIYPCFAKT